jgi:quercetin dioxygenase-like cupin family protein
VIGSTAASPYRLDATRGRLEVWWLGGEDRAGRVAIKTSSEATGARLAQLEFIDPRGTVTPMHVHHREDETFFVIDGMARVCVGDEHFELSAGDFAFMPKGVPHAYLVRSPLLRALVTYAPAGFEAFFLEAGEPVDDLRFPPPPVLRDPGHVGRRLAAYGVEIVAPPPFPVDDGGPSRRGEG